MFPPVHLGYQSLEVVSVCLGKFVVIAFLQNLLLMLKTEEIINADTL